MFKKSNISKSIYIYIYIQKFPLQILHKFSTPRLSFSHRDIGSSKKSPCSSSILVRTNLEGYIKLDPIKWRERKKGRERENKHGRGNLRKKITIKRSQVNPFLERDNHRSDQASNLTGHPPVAAACPALLPDKSPLPSPRVCRPFDRHARSEERQKNGSSGTI